jgi:DNA-binding NtrC family response regulator
MMIMHEQNIGKLKIMIIEDEEDILILYTHYLPNRGHDVVCSSLNANNIMADFDKNLPDICLMDYKLPGHTSGVNAAIEILTKYPLSPILFITAYEPLRKEIFNNPFFKDKNIDVLIKPVRLNEIEKVMLNLVKKTQ